MRRERRVFPARLGTGMRSSAFGVRQLAIASMLVGVFSTVLAPAKLVAQEESPSLGDFARDLRRNKAQQQVEQAQPVPPPPVIDNENLSQALENIERMKSAEKLVFSIDPNGKSFRLLSPDVSCSLAFNGRNNSLLIQPVLVEDLPLADLLKLDGPASIQDDTLQLEVLNGTEWELREITVGITLERNAGRNAELAARARVIPAAENSASVTIERRSDMTLLFHLKADAKPFSSTIFRENIGITPSADEDWRWSIVAAKGVRPGPRLIAPETLPAAPQLALPNPVPPGAGSHGATRPASGASSGSPSQTPDSLPHP
jgi:hypothetical protein